MSDPRTFTVWLLKEGESLPLNAGGATLRTGMLSRTLSRLGANVTWFTSDFDHGSKSYPYKFSSLDVEPGFRIELIHGIGYRKNVSIRRICHHFQTACGFLYRALKLEPPDLIVAAYPSPELSLFAGIYCRVRGVPLVLDVRDPWPEIFELRGSYLRRLAIKFLRGVYFSILRRVVNQAKAVVAVNQTMLDWTCLVSKRAVTSLDRVFYLGAHSAFFSNEKKFDVKDDFTTDDPLRVVFYGTFGSNQGFDVILETAKRLMQSGEFRVKFSLIGAGDCLDEWKKQAENLPNIEFLGWMAPAKASKVMSHAHLGCVFIRGLLSRFWFGNKFFTYLAHGLAIINDTDGEVAHTIEHLRIGNNIKSGNVAEFEEVIQYYLRNPLALKRTMRQASDIFASHFDEDLVYRDYAAYLAELSGFQLNSASSMIEKGQMVV